MSDFTNKVGLVTGAGTGIGRASAIAFGARGAAVGVLDVRAEEAAETARLVEAAGGRALPVTVDVGDEPSVAAAVSAVVDAFGGLDFAHNNAGIMGANGPLQDLGLEEWDRMLRVNLTGVFLCMKHELPHLVARGGGAIVNTSSNAGLHAVPNMPAYVASKHGVVGLSKAAAVDYGKHGVRVNALCPGSTQTPMLEAYTHGTDGVAQRVNAIPLGRLGRPEEQAAAAVWLCSEEASFATGISISLDGGRRA
ncbi:MAG TPA: glucose 1-dehydrogenase [Baekduia sp.]|uniref:SDR family NAD(P)-dependent oxidoreductase n=1 Tax=Baekduia sp. TaxID=2600305 RepID=UPI002D77D2C3|nr:glucose 1-dehydrogenase [Baekduia sp.]HET6509936.1 glucose 1-dehydrogenase [Baekduia sp.]